MHDLILFVFAFISGIFGGYVFATLPKWKLYLEEVVRKTNIKDQDLVQGLLEKCIYKESSGAKRLMYCAQIATLSIRCNCIDLINDEIYIIEDVIPESDTYAKSLIKNLRENMLNVYLLQKYLFLITNHYYETYVKSNPYKENNPYKGELQK